MKCPRCGKEMNLDNHRKIDLFMCYECGYIEGRKMEGSEIESPTNFQRLHNMNLNEAVSFLSQGFGLDENAVTAWLENK